MKKQDARSLSSSAQEALRRKAVQAVLDGKTRIEVARIFGVARQTVDHWVNKYAVHGEHILKAKPKGRPPKDTLSTHQRAVIIRAIEDKCPDQLKLPFYLWTREAVQQLIERQLGIRRSIWTIGRWLAEWGFTPQKPRRRAFEQNDKATQQWLTTEYPKLVVKAKRENARIYWGDEMGLRSDHAAGRSFSPRGQTPVIPGTGQRFRCNMISAIANRGELCFMVFKTGFSTSVMLKFLKRLIRHSGKHKIYIILDRHPVHRAVAVTRFLETHAEKIERVYLPAYSPELNPDEFLNQDVKSNSVGRNRPHSQEDMIMGVRRYLWMRQQQPDLVKRYFNADTVAYAAL